VEKNQLYYGDNLELLRQHIKDESADLIYLDPPFNSLQDYNVLFAEKEAPAPTPRSWFSRTPGSGTWTPVPSTNPNHIQTWVLILPRSVRKGGRRECMFTLNSDR